MLNAKTGSSVKACPIEAGKEAASAVKGLDGMKMAFVYSGVQYDQKDLLKSIASEIPGVPLIGNTSFTGVVTPDGFISSDEGFVGVLALSDPDLTVGVAGVERGDNPRGAGQQAAREAMAAAGRKDAPNYFYMAAPSGEEECFLKGITDVIGRVPFFGGSAADNSISGEWLLYTDQLVTANGVAVAFFYSDKPFANKFTGAYDETENMGIITKLNGIRTLAEIDGMPALKKYAQWTGQNPDDLKGGNLLAATITAPLGVKDRLGDLTAIRHPMNGNDDYSMNIGNNLAVGTCVIQMSASVDQLISSVEKTIEELKAKIGAPIGALHLVHCGGRRAGIDSRINEVAEGAKKAAAGVPFIMEFTFGEYGYEDDGNNTCGGLMLSFTAFGK